MDSKDSTSKAESLRAKLLTEGEPVLLSVIAAAKDGNAINPNYHPASQTMVWDALIPILQNTAELKKISAKSTADVLKLLQTGSVSVKDAKEIIALLNLVSGVPTGDEGQKIVIEIAKGEAI